MNTEVDAHPDCIHNRCAPWIIPENHVAGQKSGPDRIILHVCEGTFNGTRSWFQKGKSTPGRGKAPTAAHYLIGTNGDVCQMVADAKSCYHAGSHKEPHWNSRSLGIEHEGWTNKTIFGETLLSTSARIVAVLCRSYAIPIDRTHILGHSEVPGATHTDPGSTWDMDAYIERVKKASAALPPLYGQPIT